MWGRVLSSRARSVCAHLDGVPGRSNLSVKFSSGRLARLAPSAVVLTAADELTILATLAQGASAPSGGGVPLLVDFRAKAAASGVIPGTWQRREMQPAPIETLTARLIDRALRPTLLSYTGEPLQLTVSVLSSARNAAVPVDAFAINAASAAIAGADIPWAGPIGAARVARVDGEICTYPSNEELAAAEINALVAVSGKRVLSMSVEGRQDHVSNQQVMHLLGAAVDAAAAMIQPQVELAEKLRARRATDGYSSFPRQMPRPAKVLCDEESQSTSKNKLDAQLSEGDENIYSTAFELYKSAFVSCREHPGKAHRAMVVTSAQQKVIDMFPQFSMEYVLRIASKASREAHRHVLVRDQMRIDGRGFRDIRPIRCEVGVLPGEVHGSAIFERGDTQVLACTTIGLDKHAKKTEEYLSNGGADKNFFVHYSFPPYATGEAGKFAGGMSRREIGHSALAEKALEPLLDFDGSGDGIAEPLRSDQQYPYVIRLSAEVTASDGSSSMATVCAGSLAMMNAGVPLKDAVAGVAIGMVAGPDFPGKDPNDFVLLTDILGAEDHFGNLDLKVAGTMSGLTACQMDVKEPSGVPLQVVEAALDQGRAARQLILKEMDQVTENTRDAMPLHAPRVLLVPVDKVLAVKTLMREGAAGLREIEEATGTRLFLEGRQSQIRIDAPDTQSAETAASMIQRALGNIEVGTKVNVRVIDVKPTYAKVETLVGSTHGLLHASKMQIGSNQNFNSSDNFAAENCLLGTGADLPGYRNGQYPDVRQILSNGDQFEVVVLESDRTKNILRVGLLAPPPVSRTRRRNADQLPSKSVGDTIDEFLTTFRNSAN